MSYVIHMICVHNILATYLLPLSPESPGHIPLLQDGGKEMRIGSAFSFNFYFSKRFYLFIHERHTHTEAQTNAKGEAGSMQGARCGT